MRPTILEAIEIGLLEIPFRFDANPFLCICFWLCFAIGIAVQSALLLHCRGKWKRRSFALLSLCGLLLCEAACQVIIGWESLLWLILWFFCLTFLLAAIIALLVHRFFTKYRKKT